MLSPSHQFRLHLLINILLHHAATSPILLLKDIIQQASSEKEISTIAFFGHATELESILPQVDANIPRMVFTESFGDLYFEDSFNRNILVIGCINLWQRAMLNRIDVAFHGIHPATRSVYLISNYRYKNLRYLSEHFEWCWTKGFVNVIVVFTETNEMFSYTRFPEMRILAYTTADLEGSVFPNRFDNLMGYAIRTPVQNDPPRVFMYEDLRGGRHVTGYCADLFFAFLRRHNASLHEIRNVNSSDYDIPGIIQLTRKGLVDISIHAYMGLNGVRSSYPVRMMQWCILVPYRGEIKAYWYFIRPFQQDVWLTFWGLIFCISGYIAIEERLRGGNFDFGRSYCEVFRLMLGQPIVDDRPFVFLRAIRKVLTFVLGFMLSNLYLASLTSFLAKIIFEPQIKSLGELVANNISIMALDFEIPLILRNGGLPPGFDRLLVPTNATDVVLHEGVLRNQSYAYTITDDKAMFVLLQQVHLRQPLYKVVDECVSTIAIGFLMPKHSPFEIILNRFILRVSGAGLLSKWWNDMKLNGLRAGILKILPMSTQPKQPLSMEHFQFAWIALGGGIGMAFVCVVIEVIVKWVGRFKVVVLYR